MPRTVLISIDAIRADRLTDDHFPECWDVFHEHFCKYTNAYSHGTATPLAFPGIIAGTTVSGDASLGESSTTLAEMHRNISTVTTNNPHLSEERGYSRSVEQFNRSPVHETLIETTKRIAGKSALIRTIYDRLRSANSSSSSDRFVPYCPAEDLVVSLRKDLKESEGFLWYHFMDPHTPHHVQGITDRELSDNGDTAKLNKKFHDGIATEAELTKLRALYDEHMKYLDRQLSTVLREMTASKWWDDALVIIVGDHGEAFGEGGQQVHPWDEDPIEVVIKTPLLVKYPNGAYSGTVSDHLVQHSDIHATVATHTNRDVESDGFELTSTHPRTVISKSNTAIRATTDSGWIVRRRDGSETCSGNVSQEMREKVESASFPRAKMLDGTSPGTSRRGGVESRLEALGYK